jgi:hypothetical protein
MYARHRLCTGAMPIIRDTLKVQLTTWLLG